MASKQYPNTKDGAVQCLKDESTYQLDNFKQVIKDPYAEGVYAIDLADGTRVIVYLMGYGQNINAPFNDFEE